MSGRDSERHGRNLLAYAERAGYEVVGVFE